MTRGARRKQRGGGGSRGPLNEPPGRGRAGGEGRRGNAGASSRSVPESFGAAARRGRRPREAPRAGGAAWRSGSRPERRARSPLRQAAAEPERRRAVKMATPGMGWQQPQHSYGGGSAPGAGKVGSGSAQAGLGAEHSPDLHFKMSKKIAQLTKVRQPPRVFSSSALFPFAPCPHAGSDAPGEGRTVGAGGQCGWDAAGFVARRPGWSAPGRREHGPVAAGGSGRSGGPGAAHGRCRSAGPAGAVRTPPGTARYPAVRERIPRCGAGAGYLFRGNCGFSSSAVVCHSASLFKWRNSSDACLPFAEVLLFKASGNSLNALDGEGEV